MDERPKTGVATIQDVEAACGLSRDKTRQAVLRGELPAKKLGGKYVARWEWINAWIDAKPGFWQEPVANEEKTMRPSGV